MKKFNTVLSLLLVVALIFGITAYAAEDEETTTSIAEGYVSVADYGAVPNDSDDDTAAFKAAVASGNSVFVPAGKYYISEPIVLDGIILEGVPSFQTKLIGTSKDISKPMLILTGNASVSGLYMEFSDFEVTEEMNAGEKTAIQLGAENAPFDGGYIKDMIFNSVGTAIYAPDLEGSGANNFHIDTIEVQKFSYRGIDMQVKNRKGNTYSNMYINGDTNGIDTKENTSSGFALEGSEFSPVINQLNVEHTKIKTPILLKNVEAMAISSIHVEGVYTMQKDMGYLYLENSSGYIAAFTMFFTRVRYEENSVICFGDTKTPRTVRIGALQVLGVNKPDASQHPDYQDCVDFNGAAESFVFLDRRNGSSGSWNIKIGNYSYYSYNGNYKGIYEAFKCDSSLKVTMLNGTEG